MSKVSTATIALVALAIVLVVSLGAMVLMQAKHGEVPAWAESTFRTVLSIFLLLAPSPLRDKKEGAS
jgi:hypothetical protein